MVSCFKIPFNVFCIACFILLSADSFAREHIDSSRCTFNGKPLFGKIQIVDSFPDIRVQVVTAFPDLKVQKVTSFPDRCGRWQIVKSFPNTKIQFVDSFPDVKVKFVTSFPGLR